MNTSEQKISPRIFFKKEDLSKTIKKLGALEDNELTRNTISEENTFFDKWIMQLRTSSPDKLSKYIEGGIEGAPDQEVETYIAIAKRDIINSLKFLYAACVIAKAGKSLYEDDESHRNAIEGIIEETQEKCDAIVFKPPQIPKALEHTRAIAASLASPSN